MDPVEYFRHLIPVSEYVDLHIGSKITLHEAAQVAGLSDSYFSRLFHRQTGVCFKDWLLVRRVEFATILLLNQDKTVTEVCFAAGFGSISAFERSFKKVHGVTPRYFQQTERNKRLHKTKGADYSTKIADDSAKPAESPIVNAP